MSWAWTVISAHPIGRDPSGYTVAFEPYMSWAIARLPIAQAELLRKYQGVGVHCEGACAVLESAVELPAQIQTSCRSDQWRWSRPWDRRACGEAQWNSRGRGKRWWWAPVPIGIGGNNSTQAGRGERRLREISSPRRAFVEQLASRRSLNRRPLAEGVFDATGKSQAMEASFDYTDHGGAHLRGLVQGRISFDGPQFHRAADSDASRKQSATITGIFRDRGSRYRHQPVDHVPLGLARQASSGVASSRTGEGDDRRARTPILRSGRRTGAAKALQKLKGRSSPRRAAPEIAAPYGRQKRSDGVVLQAGAVQERDRVQLTQRGVRIPW